MSTSEFLAVAAIGTLVLGTVLAWKSYEGGTILFFAALTALVCGISSCSTSEWNKEAEAEKARQEAAARVPHVIREADGCKVYAFEAGGLTHMFTRCPSTVTTEAMHTERHGKTTSVVGETNVTEAQ